MKPFLRKKKISIALDIASLIDIIFMLLLFFMLTSNFIKPSIPLKLPAASNKKKIEDQDIMLSINDKGELYFNKELLSIDFLEIRLRQPMEKNENLRVIFQGDEKILYKDFVTILDKIKSAGVKDINIAHDAKTVK